MVQRTAELPMVKEAWRPRVLLVDDEPFNLDLLEQELEGLDLEIQTANNGREALDALAAAAPDIIFLDLMMPEVDGFTVLERMQGVPEWRRIPVVVISAASEMENIVRGIALGASDFLPKPFHPAILHARLQAGLEQKRLRDQEQAYLQALERELEIGRQIQAGFLPRLLPELDGWAVAASFSPAREVAGDFYDVFTLPHTHRVGLLLGDVSDKGVGAALFMTLFRSLLRAGVNPTYVAIQPLDSQAATDYLRQSVQLTNNYIADMHGDVGMFATLFFGLLDPASGSLLYINAGHEPPLIVTTDGEQRQLPPSAPVIGVLKDVDYEVKETTLAPGEMALFYSDGVIDAEDEDGRFFTRERLAELLSPLPPSAERLLERIEARLRDHVGERRQFDDITLLALYREPAGQ
ncbi:MAG: SpoIIE family protein phosphatase [Candidatus Promineifilaceae bacterium]|nr:SpoIIE family protein phosphatase [Candidatus Promineifilaceae bacterium]